MNILEPPTRSQILMGNIIATLGALMMYGSVLGFVVAQVWGWWILDISMILLGSGIPIATFIAGTLVVNHVVKDDNTS